MGILCLLILLVLKGSLVFGKSSVPSILVASSPYSRYTCMMGAKEMQEFSRPSWLLVTGKEEKQYNKNSAEDGTQLDLVLEEHKVYSAQLVCRAYNRTSYNQVVVSEPLTLILNETLRQTQQKVKDKTVSIVAASIGGQKFTEGGSLTRSPGDELEVTCGAAHLPRPADMDLYIYVLLRTERGDIETEISGAYVTDKRVKEVSGRVTMRAEHHGADISCLARWFVRSDAHYDSPAALRSEPVKLVVADAREAETSTVLLVAVGVGVLGWLVAVSLLAALLILRKRYKYNASKSENDTEEVYASPNDYEYTTVHSSARAVEGATVLPHAAHSPANKLTPATTAPSAYREDSEGPTYCNLEELNTLVKKRMFP